MINLNPAQEKLLRKYPLEVGKRYRMSGIGDFGIDVDARPFLSQDLLVTKHLKSGLYQTQLPDGRVYSFPKSAMWPTEGEVYEYLGVGMKTVQEGSLADAYKRALDTANTTAIYVSYEDIEAIHAGVEQVCVDLEHSEEQLQDILDANNSTVVLISFEPEDTLEQIVVTVRDFLEGEGVRAVVSPHHEIVKAVRESFNVNQA